MRKASDQAGAPAARRRGPAALSLALGAVMFLAGCSKHSATFVPSHWSHINVLIPGREVGFSAPNSAKRQAYNEWIASHADAVETRMDSYQYRMGDNNCPNLKGLNPGIKTIGYDVDMTIWQVPELSDLPEDFYLHFSEDTRLAWAGVTIDIPGCPISSPPTRASRVQMYDGQVKWLPNLGSIEWRRWYANHLIDEMTRDFRNGAANPIDIVQLDDHADIMGDVMRLNYQTTIVSGGGIREYDGLVPTIVRDTRTPLDVLWHADLLDWLTYLQGRLASVNKSAHINVGEYFAEPGHQQQVMTIRGATAEMVHSPFHNAIFNPTLYQHVIDLIAQLTAIGGTINLQPGAFSGSVPANYTAGNYGGPLDRAKMWNLAGYYLVKEAAGQSGMVYFNPQLPETPDLAAYAAEWLPAYEKDVGLPQGSVFSAQEGNVPGTGQAYKIFGRQYSKALVLVRTRDNWGATDYSDVTAVTVRLPRSMVMLEPDGTSSPPVDSVLVRNAEAVILFPAP